MSVAAAPTEHPDNCVLVIFGASGDLTQRKLVPALYELHCDGLLPERFCVLGVSRSPKADDAWREELRAAAVKFTHKFDAARWAEFARLIHYHAADASSIDAYPAFIKRTEELAADHGVTRVKGKPPNYLFYLSVSPTLYIPIISCIGQAGLVSEGKRWCSLDRESLPWQRIIVEKPFGEDLKTCIELNQALGRVFEEEATFRIDHYLGKELVQNLLVNRFANRVFEPVWNNQHIDHVQITAAETVGVGSRAANFYDTAGAMRDMIQSHLLQVMSLVALEPPSAYEADALARERIKVFHAIRPIPVERAHEFCALGRYAAGPGKDGPEPAYVSEKGVDASRNTDTFCALKVHIDNWRWAGVPFYLRSGKRMPRKLTEIVIQFKPPPTWIFPVRPRAGELGRLADAEGARAPLNRIVINIQPDDGISLRLEAKVPGPKLLIDSVKLDMDYSKTFNTQAIEAYGPLLLDAMRGDRMLYKHRLEVEGAWRVCQPLLDSPEPRKRIETYEPNTWGPKGSDALLAAGGRIWHNPASEKR